MSATVFYASSSELATLTNSFYAGSPSILTDPSAVSLAVTDPTGSTTTYTYAGATITKTTTGVYTKDIACSTAGVWQYVWTGSGTASDVVAGTFTVFNTDLQKNYCSLEELKSRLGSAATSTTNDFELKVAIETAARAIDSICDRRFWRGTDTRTFTACDLYQVHIDDLVSVTTLKTDDAGDGTFETTWDTSDYQLLPVNPSAAPETRPYTSVRAVAGRTFPLPWGANARKDRVQIVGVYGWPAVPVAIKQACLLLAVDYYKLKDAPFGVQNYGDFALRVRENPRAMGLLAPYERYPVLVG